MKRWAPKAYPGPSNTHRNADPGAGIRGSWPDADGYQQMIDEITNTVTSSGQAESDTDDFQLWKAIQSSGRGTQVTFASNGNFTVPANVYQIFIQGWGGGGGGGGSLNANSAGSGGGGAAYREGAFAVTPGQVIPITIGAGGTAGIAGGGNGGLGGTTSVGALLSAGGGAGGLGASAGTSGTPQFASPGGVGGSGGSGGSYSRNGLPGGTGFQTGSTSLLAGGQGGASHLGTPSQISVNATGVAGVGPGGGGGGATANAAGGAGAAGFVRITY